MNWIIKFAGIALTVLCTTLFGFAGARAKRDRISRLRSVDSALASAGNLLKYGNLSRRELLRTAFCRVDNLFRDGEARIEDPAMSRELTAALNGFLSEFGSGDKSAEQARINRIRHTLSDEINRLQEEYVKSGKLWRITGFCSGLALGIILI